MILDEINKFKTITELLITTRQKIVMKLCLNNY